uniref:Uncharacterized protein n=1 Tax=Anguilla anguilla TaxID=7936 RepID=A0A0E9QMY9_ANGAN
MSTEYTFWPISTLFSGKTLNNITI